MIRKWFSDSSGHKEILISLHERPSESQQERMENFQITVSFAVLTAFFTVGTGPETLFQGAEPILATFSIISLLFISTKLILITIRPFYDSIWLKRVDYAFAPLLFVLTLLGGLGFASLALLHSSQLNQIWAIGWIVDYVRKILINEIVKKVYVVGIAVAAFAYAWRSANTMSVIRTGVPEFDYSYTGGSTDNTIPLKLKNPFNHMVEPTDLEIDVDTTEGIEVRITGAQETSSGTWQPFVPIQPHEQSELTLNIHGVSESDEIEEEEIHVTVRYQGETMESQVINVRG